MIDQMTKKICDGEESAKVFCNHQEIFEGSFEISNAFEVRIFKSLLVLVNENSELDTGPVTIMIFMKHS